jgi:hypothetical protein
MGKRSEWRRLLLDQMLQKVRGYSGLLTEENTKHHSLPDEDGGKHSRGLLISETVPGFEFCNHDVLSPRGLQELLGNEGAEELS